MTELDRSQQYITNANARMLHEMARYSFIDKVIGDALQRMPGHPLMQYMQGVKHRVERRENLLEMAYVECLAREYMRGPEEVKDSVCQVLRYFLLDVYEHEYHMDRQRKQIGINADFNGQRLSYLLPESLKRLTPNQQFDVVMRELAPAVIAMLTKEY